jgi:tripartite-type tricarboxylate transporter receptor subunit TctC
MMNRKFPRRQFMRLAAVAAALPAVSRIASAQAYPSRPVRIIHGFAAGGAFEVFVRPIVQLLSERLGRPVIIETRPGANGNIATEAVARAAADGHALLLLTGSNTINAMLYDKLSFDFARDIVPIAGIARVANVMVVNPSVPARSVPEFIAYAAANPGKINVASAGTGSPGHMTGELFKMMTGVNMAHVPYRGQGAALPDLLSGQVQVMFGALPASIEYIKVGSLRALAVTSAARVEAVADVPAMADFLPGFEISNWWGIGAPRSTPAGIIDRLNREINATLLDSRVKARLADAGAVAIPGSPAELGKLIADDIEKWAKVVKFAGIKPE